MNTDKLYVVGGREKRKSSGKKTWQKYDKGIIAQVDVDSGLAERVVEYASPPEAHAATGGASISFGAATLQDDRLYVCTKTEVLIYQLPAFEQIGYVSLPCFNDLHHVCPTKEGTLLVASTGLDLIVEITPEGKVVRELNVLGEDPWERFSKEVDYRKVASIKPHHSHPNYVFYIGEELWVTRFEQRDAVCLTQPGLRFKLGIEKPHDGIVLNGRVYFTIVSGYIMLANIAKGKVEKVYNLNKMTDRKTALGWCRGLKLVDENRVIVGFTRFRPTKIESNLRWVKYAFGKTAYGGEKYQPTRIAQYDLEKGELMWEFDVESVGLNCIFSIH